MKKIAVLFAHAPYGSNTGREGLDTVLALSAMVNDISLFFIGDGVFQLLNEQQPDIILSRNYSATFGVLPLYDITHCYLCQQSLQQRGLDRLNEKQWVLSVQIKPYDFIQQQLAAADTVITF